LQPVETLLDAENFTLEFCRGWRTSWLHGYAAPQGWPMQQRIMTKRQREILELRDACMLLVAQLGNQREMNGAPTMEVTLGPFTIWLTPGGVRRKLDVWHASAGSTKVLDLGWSGDKLEIVSFRRGAWEQELLGLARRAPSR
jgi:hypothetical protein